MSNSLHKMKSLVKFLTIFVLLKFQKCHTSKILIIHTTVIKSHLFPLQILAISLAKERQHQVTFVSSYPMNKNITNLRELFVPFNEKDRAYMHKISQSSKQGNVLKVLKNTAITMANIGNNTLQSVEIRKLMKTEEFDLLILGYYMNEYMLGLGDHFKCPTIIFAPSSIYSTLHLITGNPFSVAASNHFLLQGEKYDFGGRMKNFLVQAFDYIFLKNFFEYYGKQVYSYNFPATKYRSYSDSTKNVSLLLLNSHFSIGSLRPLLPNVIEVGGMQVIKKVSPLPKDIKNFLDSAEHGAILFSLGSKVDVDFFPNEALEIIVKVFLSLKQKVIMKWGTKEFQNKPENVFIGEWLPQNDILAHENVRLFISHCGVNGIMEAKHHGVPIIGNPLYSDQFGNAKKIESEGWGRVVDLKLITEKEFKDVILEVLSNKRYSETAKQQSLIQSDRPLDAEKLALYWIEYVIRHRGAPHLHFPAANMNFLQINSLDVLAVILIALFLMLYIVKKILTIIWKLCRLRQKLKIN